MTPSLLFLLALAAGPAPAAGPAEFQDAFADLAAKAKPAVVHINTVAEETVRVPPYFFGDPDEFFYEFFHGQPQQRQRTFQRQLRGSGTGFCVDPRGYILTNEHVIRGADDIKVVFTDASGRETHYKGKVMGTAAYLDLAVVKLLDEGPFPALTLGDSDKVGVGDWAIAIGNPFALGQTVTVGVISALRQSLVIDGRRYPNILQTDAAINRGNSGGPLLNLKGDVVGINTAIYSPTGASAGVGFAITVNEAKSVLASLIAGKSIKPGWLGIEVGPVDAALQRRFRLPAAEGALVNGVLEDSPAHKAGLKRGDVIRRLGIHDITSPEDLVGAAMATSPGTKADVEFFRGGRKQTASIRVTERPEQPKAAPGRQRKPGGEMYAWKGTEFEETAGGLRVGHVDAGSALKGYLAEGDMVQGVNQSETRDLESLKTVLEIADLTNGVVFDIQRDGQPMYISVQSGQ